MIRNEKNTTYYSPLSKYKRQIEVSNQLGNQMREYWIFIPDILRKLIFTSSIFILLSSLFISCSDDNNNCQATNGQTLVSISVRAASSSINEDKVYWEDRVDELRMLVADPSTGKITLNTKLSFPNGFALRSNAVRMQPGNYDFYFIANETAYDNSFSSALETISNVSDFNTDPRFTQLQYNQAFSPDGTTSTGRFLMSAQYKGLEIVSGGTITNPLPLNVPNGKVELIRALAKVEIIFRKKTSGSTIPANSINQISLANVASEYSVPPLDSFYAAQTGTSPVTTPQDFNYDNDSIGSVSYYIPELLREETTGADTYTELHVNNKAYAIESDNTLRGLAEQRRTIPSISPYSIVRNYHYIINVYISPQGGIQFVVCVKPWNKDSYKYMFYGDNDFVIPPVTPTDSTVIINTECGKVEIRSENETLSGGLQQAYGDQVNWWDPEIQGPTIIPGQPPYYCEKKYGPGWRLIESCELISLLRVFDQAYRVWESNTWLADDNGLPFYPLKFRQEAQELLSKITGYDMSGYVLSDNGKDSMGDEKLNFLDRYFTPGDIMLRESDYPNGWPYPTPPNNNGLAWYPSETVVQVKGYWYADYHDPNDPANREKILYQEFRRYDYASTVSRCVRSVE